MVKKLQAKELSVDKGTYMIYANPGMGKTYALGFLPGKTLVLVSMALHPLWRNILTKKISKFGD